MEEMTKELAAAAATNQRQQQSHAFQETADLRAKDASLRTAEAVNAKLKVRPKLKP